VSVYVYECVYLVCMRFILCVCVLIFVCVCIVCVCVLCVCVYVFSEVIKHILYKGLHIYI